MEKSSRINVEIKKKYFREGKTIEKIQLLRDYGT